jgi:hypothetical protein
VANLSANSAPYMDTDVYALRGLLADAAAKWESGQRIPAKDSMCKLFGLKVVSRVTDLYPQAPHREAVPRC